MNRTSSMLQALEVTVTVTRRLCELNRTGITATVNQLCMHHMISTYQCWRLMHANLLGQKCKNAHLLPEGAAGVLQQPAMYITI